MQNYLYKKNPAFFILLFSELFFAGLQTLHAQDAKDYFAKGKELYLQKKYNEALDYLDKAIELNPDYGAAYTTRGNVFYAMRKYEDAFLDYTDAIDIDPKGSANYYNRGNVYSAYRMYDSALADYDMALHYGPGNAMAFLAKGNVLNNSRLYSEALQNFDRAIALKPDMMLAYNGKGLSYLFMGNYNESVASFKQAISIDVNFEKAYIILNIIEPLARQGNFADAADYFARYNANYSSGYIENADWKFYKKYAEAVTTFMPKNDFPNALNSLMQAEKLYNAKNRDDDDDNNFKQRCYSAILALKGFVLEKMNRIDQAKQYYDQTLLVNANQPEVQDALQRLSQKKQAITRDDNTPPSLRILEPLANSRSISVDDDKPVSLKQHIRGVASDPSGIRTVKMNNRNLSVDEKGYFDTVVNIDPAQAVNVFTIVVTDNNANSVSENVQVASAKNAAPASAAMAKENPVQNCNPVYHAVLIAEKNYANRNIPSLPGTVKDMRKMYNLLVNYYNFLPSNVDTLVDASRVTIMETLLKRGNDMNENDNLLIFYAGHGEMRTRSNGNEEGFLIPQDAVPNAESTYINSYELVGTFKDSKAMHVLFVADACFAGQLFRRVMADAPPPKSTCAELSRNLVASGNRKPVPDNSPFIQYFTDALSKNRKQDITVEELIDSFKYTYHDETQLDLQFYPINVGDQGGHFVFKRKS